MHIKVTALQTGVFLALAAPRLFAQSAYTATDLGTFAGGSGSLAQNLNDAGTVVGQATTATGEIHGCVWSASGSIIDIPPFAGTKSVAHAINGAGVVVGESTISTASSLVHAFVWQNGVSQDLGTFDGTGSSFANDINSAGVVVGAATRNSYRHAALWENGQIRDLGLPGTESVALAVNQNKQVVGWLRSSYGNLEPFVWSNGSYLELPSLLVARDAQALDINDNGVIVGSAYNSATVPVYWDAGGAIHQMGVLPGDTMGSATSINNSGQIAGTSNASGSTVTHPFLYTRGDLEALSVLLPSGSSLAPQTAPALNNSAQLAASTATTLGHGVRLDPTSFPRLVFATQPGSARVHTPLNPQPVVEARDAQGNVRSDFNGPVTLTAMNGAAVSGATVSAVAGVATFTNASLDQPGVGVVLVANGPSIVRGLSAPFTSGAQVIYVAPVGVDTNSGESWLLAKHTVGGAIASPLRMSGTEVWVASGTFNQPIIVKPGVALYGGFRGTETAREQRDPKANVSELTATNPSGTVVMFDLNCTSNTVVDGFTISSGTTGVMMTTGAPIVRGNVIAGNANGLTLGTSGSPLIERNVIAYNSGGSGAGLNISSGSAIVRDNIFRGNVAYSTFYSPTGTPGGAISCTNSSAHITNNTFIANCASDGGQLYVSAGAPVVANNIFAYGYTGVLVSGGTADLHNNCFWSNVRYDIQGNANGLGVNGNVAADPRIGGSPKAETRIQPDSPCRDAGDDSVVSSGETDQDGQPRIQGVHVDIGADESDGTPLAPSAGVLRVSTAGNDANDGHTWASAKRTVSAALATSAVTGEDVWVAQGEYDESLTADSFTHLYGGFNGTEQSVEQRNPARNVTVLTSTGLSSGVAMAMGTVQATVDGFTVRSANPADPLLAHDGIAVGPLSAVVITDNEVRENGRYGIFVQGSTTVADNHCLLNGFGVLAQDDSSVTGNLIEQNSIQVSAAGVAAGINLAGRATAIGNVVRDNIGMGISSSGSSTLVKNNTVLDNVGDGVYCYNGSGPIVDNLIAGNEEAGVELYSAGSVTITNNTIVGNLCRNIAKAGGGIYGTGTPVLVNNIIADNNGGVFTYSTATFRDNTFFANGPFDVSGSPNPVGSMGNVDVDPVFVDAVNGDYHVQPSSPCVSAGDTTVVATGDTDIDGEPRIQGAQVDVGSDESDGQPRVAAHNRIYVSTEGSDAATGSSWDEAKATVQAGINAVQGLGGGDVWVAQGVYTANLTLVAHVRLYGGFAATETDLASRDASHNLTVLDGHALGPVIQTSGTAIGSIIDGFTIQNGSGSGVVAPDGSITISNNVITGCTGVNGGGIFAGGGLPLITGNTVVGNSASSEGGGIYAGGAVEVSDNVIEGNSAPTGGAAWLYNDPISYMMTPLPLIFERNVVRGNTATDGAGVYSGGMQAYVRDNLFLGNAASEKGGGWLSQWGSTASNNTFVKNTAPLGGGACIDFPGGSYTINHGNMWNNIVAYNSSGVAVVKVGTVRTNDVFGNGTANYDGGADQTGSNGNVSVDPLFLDVSSDNFHLAFGSRCRDFGDDSKVSSGETDLLGNPRILGKHVDLGAYEAMPGLSIADAIRALRIAGGLVQATNDDRNYLNVAGTAVPVALDDAVGIARQSLGANP